MYPVGFLTLAAFLRRNGYRVRIVDLAMRMVRSLRVRPDKAELFEPGTFLRNFRLGGILRMLLSSARD